MSSLTDIHWKLGSILSEQKCHKFVVTTPFTRLVLFIEETKMMGVGGGRGLCILHSISKMGSQRREC